MTILIVAPRSDLATLDSEVSALVRSFHRPILVQGYVTEAELQRALTTDVDAFWFCGHSGADGIMLSNGILPPSALAQYLSTASVEWSFFNSCDSSAFVDRLQSAYPHNCYANITAIADQTAWRTAQLVALNYGDVGDIDRAVRLAAPPGTTPLRYFPSPSGGRGNMSQKDIEQVEQLSEQLRELNRVLTGDRRFRERGLIESVQHLESQYAAVMSELERQRFWLYVNGAGWIAVMLLELWLRFGR